MFHIRRLQNCQFQMSALHSSATSFPEEHVEGARHSTATCLRLKSEDLPNLLWLASLHSWCYSLSKLDLHQRDLPVEKNHFARISLSCFLQAPCCYDKRYKTSSDTRKLPWKGWNVRSQHIPKAMHYIISKSMWKMYQWALCLCLSPGGQPSVSDSRDDKRLSPNIWMAFCLEYPSRNQDVTSSGELPLWMFSYCSHFTKLW